MDVYQLTLLTLLSGVGAITFSHHYPQVRENASSTIHPKQAGQYYSPVFGYGRVAQPDMQKWRYYQQQQVDAKNLAKFKDQIRPIYHKRLNMDRNGWIPKPVLNKQKKRSPEIPSGNAKRDYRMEEIQDTQSNNQPTGFLPSPQFLTGHVIYDQNNQGIANLNLLSGQSDHLQGLQKLLQEQSKSSSLLQTPNTLDSQNILKYQNIPQKVLQLEGILPPQIIIQPQNDLVPHAAQDLQKPQQINNLQEHLDLLSQGHVQQLLQEAQQRAADQVKLQHDALEKIKIEAERAALAKIRAHNSGVEDVSLQVPSNVIDEKPENPNVEQLPIPLALISDNTNHDAAIQHAVSQAQAFLQQSSQKDFLKPTFKEVKIINIDGPQQPPTASYKPSYPNPQDNGILKNNSINIKSIEPIGNEVTPRELEDNEDAEDYNEEFSVSNVTIKVRLKRDNNNSNDTTSYDTNTNKSEELPTDLPESLPSPESLVAYDTSEDHYHDYEEDMAVYRRVRPPWKNKPHNYEHDDQIMEPSYERGSHIKFHVPTRIHTIHHHHDHLKPIVPEKEFEQYYDHFEDFPDFDHHVDYHDHHQGHKQYEVPGKHHPTYIVINNSNHANHGKHKKHPRITRKRPKINHKKYSKIDSKIRKAISNLNKFLSRHKISP